MTRRARRGSAPTRLAIAALVLAGCGAPQRIAEPVGEAVNHAGRVLVARGPTMAREGDRCDIEVQAADGLRLNCRIRVRCSGDTIYGLAGAGFNDCRRDGDTLVFAHDHHGTRRDGDPRMFFDLRAGRLIVSDDDPDVEVLIDLMTRPDGYDDPSDASPGTSPSGRPET